MQRNVWDKAAADSNGLKKYYDAHKGNYWWDASAEAIILTAVNEAAATEARKKLEADYRSWKKMVDGSEGSIQADSGRFELGQIPVLERTNWQPGLYHRSGKERNGQQPHLCLHHQAIHGSAAKGFCRCKGLRHQRLPGRPGRKMDHRTEKEISAQGQ